MNPRELVKQIPEAERQALVDRAVGRLGLPVSEALELRKLDPIANVWLARMVAAEVGRAADHEPEGMP